MIERDQLDQLRALGDVAVSLTVVASLVGVHRYSVTRWEAQGKFPLRIPNRGRPFYRASDVVQWLSGTWGQVPRRSFLRSHRRVG